MAQVIGIDIGATKITGTLLAGNKILKSLTVVTPKNLEGFKRTLLKLLDFLNPEGKVKLVGIGMAGRINLNSGVAVHSPNIKYIQNFPLASWLGRQRGYKAKIDNDAKCFARAESVLGAGKGLSYTVGITLGTGIGAGLVNNEKVFFGTHFCAGEVGHMLYLGKQTFEQAFKIARDAKDNKTLGLIVGVLFTNIYRILDPSVIIVGGGVALDKNRNFMPQAIKFCAKNLSSYRVKPNIKISKLKNAGALGAALLWN